MEGRDSKCAPLRCKKPRRDCIGGVPVPWKVLEETKENDERKVFVTHDGIYPITPEIAEEMMEVQ